MGTNTHLSMGLPADLVAEATRILTESQKKRDEDAAAERQKQSEKSSKESK